MTCRSSLRVAAALLLWPLVSGAQVVRGTVVDRVTATPLPGVVVLLLDSAGNTLKRVLTDDRGAYRLAAGRAGTYRVRTLRIGFRPGTSQPIDLAVGQEVSAAPLFAGAAVSLDTIRIVGRSACRVRHDSAAATFAVWEQIRTALSATQATAAAQDLGVTIVTYQRSLDREGRRVLFEQSGIRKGITAHAWKSVPVDSLRRAGYAVTEKDGTTTYFAPDLDVLMSEEFAEDHCLRLVSDSGQLGVAFEPTGARRRVPEIRGTLWVDRASLELRRLEMRYVNLTREQESVAGGDLEFLRLPQGMWLISRWNIRVPVIETVYHSESRLQAMGRPIGRSVREIRVDGGDLALVTRERDTLWARPPLTLAGSVRDSVSDAWIASAAVTIRGTGLAARTDSVGAFRIPGVLPGEYTVDIVTPALESIGETRSAPLTFIDGATDFAARVPDAAHVARTLCGPDTSGMLAGRVRLSGDSTPPRNVKVVIAWDSFARGGADSPTLPRWIDATTDARGRFRVCGVPRNTALTARVEGGPGAAKPVAAQIPVDRQFGSVEILLDPEGTRTATLAGLVLSDVGGQPIVGAEVALPALGRNVFTNEQGAFRLSEIPPGSHDVLVRRFGYRPLNQAIVFAENQLVERRLLLSRVVTLDTVSVIANVRLAEFERNRAMGLGHFLTRADLEKQQQRELGELLAQLPGVRIMRSATNAYVANRRAMGTSMVLEATKCDLLRFEVRPPAPRCGCYAQVYLDDALLYGGGDSEIIPDINLIPPSWIEAIEYYAGPAQTPARYSRMNAQCGVLVIHMRRTP